MHQNKRSAIYVSLFISYLLFFLPWSDHALQYKPDFTLLVLLFWLIRAPFQCNIRTAWVVGLLVDLVTGGTFGQHALAYTFSAYFTLLYQRRLILFNHFHLFWTVFLLLIISQVVLLILQTFAGNPFVGWIYFAPSMTGVILWSISLMLRLHTDGRAGQM